MYQANSQPVAYVVCLSSRPCAFAVSWNSLTNGVVGERRVVDVLDVLDQMYVPSPVRPWSMSGWKNWLSEPHVADMMTIGFQSVFFSISAMAWVQNAPDVSISSTSAPEAASVVNWFVEVRRGRLVELLRRRP